VDTGAGRGVALRLFKRNDFRRRLQRAEERSLALLGVRALGHGLLNAHWLRCNVFMTMQRQRSRPDVIGRSRNHHSGQPSPAPEATVIVLAIAETTILAAHLSTFMFAADENCSGTPLQGRVPSGFSGIPSEALLRR
jgi:hypothetical protein